jgi:hypothetical protein
MGARWIVPLTVLVLSGCTTVSLARLDRCTYRRTQTLGGAKDEILFCDQDPPQWSSDRAIRLAQECLRTEYELRRDLLIAAGLSGKPIPMPAADPAFSQCIPESLRVIQSENEQLKDRVAGLDRTRAELEQHLAETRASDARELSDARSESTKRLDEAQARLERHMSEEVQHLATQQSALQASLANGLDGLTQGMSKGLSGLTNGYTGVATGLTGTLARALDRPVNAYADARSSSDSGAQTRHQSSTTSADQKASTPAPDAHVSASGPDTRVNVSVGAPSRTGSAVPVKKAKACVPAVDAPAAPGPSLASDTAAPPKN